MIAIFINYDETRRKAFVRPRAYVHRGDMAFVRHQVHLLREDGTCFARRAKVTLFDDSVTPPKLIREDYDLKRLRKLKAKLPPLFTDAQGNIRDLNLNLIMKGPDAT